MDQGHLGFERRAKPGVGDWMRIVGKRSDPPSSFPHCGLFWRKNMRQGPTTQTEENLHRGRNGIESGHFSAEQDPTTDADSNLPIQLQPTFEPVLDSEEAAALLKIHPKTLQKLARDGKIPGVRIGKLWAFRASTLNRWLESKMPT